jgi:integrase
VAPLNDVLRLTHADWRERHAVVHLLLAEMAQRRSAFWAWTRLEWLATLRATPAPLRQYVMAVPYLLLGLTDLHVEFARFKRRIFAWKVFGRAPVDVSVQQVCDELRRWGYGGSIGDHDAPRALCELLLVQGSPRVEDLTPELIAAVHARAGSIELRPGVRLVARALVALGLLAASPIPQVADDAAWLVGTAAAAVDVPPTWVEWSQRWYRTSTLARKSRQAGYYYLLKVGRWLAETHPEAADPAGWTRELAAAFVAAVDRMVVGEWAHTPTTCRYAERLGAPIRARTKDRQLGALRTFFRDAQEWGWLPRRFDPARALATPRAVRALIGPEPRVIADDLWAKLLWAGLNLTARDLPRHARPGGAPWYPPEMARAVVVLWLFAGLRVDELARLRVGCVRWQHADEGAAGTTAAVPRDAVCLLDVPAHKTGLPYTKPVDRAVGEAIAAWERVRPPQPALPDRKTGEPVHLLFAYRGQAMSRNYVNRTLIPLLCGKANIPARDARGSFTSHRARSTIASQLFNAREPMTLFELQEWLGHRSPVATQQYVKITPTKLARAYADAGYFGRNLRMIEVLIDQDVIRSGAAAQGAPWRYYDLGHGYCTYDFFDQCPHRMACARCAFYRPKGSSQAQLLEAQANLLRLKQEIPLTEAECAAVDDGLTALARLCAQLADVPTPAGPTPRQLAGEPGVIPLRTLT